MGVSWPRGVNASRLVRPIHSPPLERVPLATQTARPVPGLRSINVQAAHPTDLSFPTAAAFRRALRLNFSTLRAGAVSRAMAAVRVVPVPGQATALHVQARARSFAEGLAFRRTATGMARRRPPRPSSPASASVSRILCQPHRSQGHPFQSRFLPSRG
jgi:hypothetical protein